MNLHPSLFWAKTTDDKDNPQRENAFHPLICHMLDVAMAAQGIWENVLTATQKRRLAKLFNLDNDLEKAGDLLAFLVGLHDLGKCSPPFALRGKYKPESEQTRRLYGLYENSAFDLESFLPAAEARHEFVTSIVLPPILQKKFNFPKTFAEKVSDIIGGHHGSFPTTNFQNKNKSLESVCGTPVWGEAQSELVRQLAETLRIEGDFSHLENQKIDNAAAMIFAGFVTAADWVGSNADYFKCFCEDSTKIDRNFTVDLEDYRNYSQVQALKALKELGWLDWVSVTAQKKFEELFPLLKTPRHLQIVAQKIAEGLNSVGIVIVEERMGEGKTETAMFLADVFNAVLKQRGIYFALPTQATSNQMFGRVKNFLSAKYSGDARGKAILNLHHGHASINAEFEELKQPDSKSKRKNDPNKFTPIFDDSQTSMEKSKVIAEEWFTYKKRGLFVPFGVGTIDQILLGVLQVKHVFVRLFGLAHKTIIIDEVHAYDAYMSTLLERLLEWLAALGSPVIILSATLPKNRRDALIKAYLKGLGQKPEDLENLEPTGDRDEYPRISYATENTETGKFNVRHLGFPGRAAKTLYLEWKDRENFVEDLIKTLAPEGGCVAVICNTVKEAQETYERLRNEPFFQGDADDELPKLDLLHARFRFKDRDAREKRALLRFGKKGEKVSFVENGETVEREVKRPSCAVLVSTQIIEQSLDLDFDLMISEHAPADLLLQRSGRLQRHDRARSDAFKLPTLWILKPELGEHGNLSKTAKDEPDFGTNGIVYDKHILLRSWLKLRNCSQIEIPNDIENLIEDVYDAERYFDNLTSGEKEMWQTTAENYRINCRKEEDIAQTIYLNSPHYKQHLGNFVRNPKEEDAPELHPAHQAQTRLVEPTANVVCLWEKNGKIFSDETYRREISLKEKPTKYTAKELLFNSVTVSTKSVVFDLLREEVPEGWRKFALLMRHRILLFGADRKCRMFGYVFYLDEKLGLRIGREEEN